MLPVILLSLFFLALIAIIILVVRYGKKKNKQKNEWYQQLAEKMGLTYSESKHFFVKIPHIGGIWKEHYIEIYEQIVGSGKNQTVYTNIRYNKSPHNFQFKIGKEHFFSKIGKKMGFKDIEFDNVELDKKFLFKSKDESQFRTLMDYKLLYDLEGIMDSFRGTIQNQDGVLSYSMVGAATKKERLDELEEIIEFMRKLMDQGNGR